MGDKSGETRKETNWLGETKEVHYDSAGNKIGETRFSSDWLGGSKQEHYDSSGNKTGETRRGTDWLGRDRAEHFDTEGRKVGFSEDDRDWMGDPVQHHYDPSGNRVGSTRGTESWLGEHRKEHEGRWFKALERPQSDIYQRGHYGGGGTGTYGSSWSGDSPAVYSREYSGKWLWVVLLIIVGIVAISAAAAGANNFVQSRRVTSISINRVVVDIDSLLLAFQLLNSKNTPIVSDGEGLLRIYDGLGNLLYSHDLVFLKNEFTKGTDLSYIWKIPKNQFDVPTGSIIFTSGRIRNATVTLEIRPNGKSQSFTNSQKAIDFYIEGDAELAVRQARISLGEWIAGQGRRAATRDIVAVENDVWAALSVQSANNNERFLTIVHNADPANRRSWEVQFYDYGNIFLGRPEPFYIDFADSKEGWVASDKSVYHTTDGGKSWSQGWRCGSPFEELKSFQWISRDHLRGSLSGGATLESQSGGKTWSTEGGFSTC